MNELYSNTAFFETLVLNLTILTSFGTDTLDVEVLIISEGHCVKNFNKFGLIIEEKILNKKRFTFSGASDTYMHIISYITCMTGRHAEAL